MKDVLLNIKSTQLVNGEEGRIELVTDGTYDYSEQSVSFEYQESELTGFSGTTTRFTVSGRTVTITRTGSLRSSMVFDLGRRNDFLYETDDCSLTMTVNTDFLRMNLDETGGTLEIRYSLEVSGVNISYNTFYIQIK